MSKGVSYGGTVAGSPVRFASVGARGYSPKSVVSTGKTASYPVWDPFVGDTTLEKAYSGGGYAGKSWNARLQPSSKPGTSGKGSGGGRVSAGSGSGRSDYFDYIRGLDSYCLSHGIPIVADSAFDHHAAYQKWQTVCQMVRAKKSAKKGPAQDYYQIVPTRYARGSIKFHDRHGHGDVRCTLMPNRLYKMEGPANLVGKLGGRGEFDTLIRHMSDRNYFNDK